MKKFEEYQYLDGEMMTERDKLEVGSKFWNRGKWDNFVAPFLPEDCSDLAFVDMGCNAGLFLKFAQDRKFGQVIGVDSNEGAVNRGLIWRDKMGGTYQIRLSEMGDSIDNLPIVDYTTLANAHYYFTIEKWLDYLDKLQYKTRYCIIVTAESRFKNRNAALTDVPSIRNYFRGWDETGFINALPTEGDPMPRKLWSLCFKSHHIEKAPIESLMSSNHYQDNFYAELDKGTPFQETHYFRVMRRVHRRWPEEEFINWIRERIKIYEDVKKNRLIKPILIDSENIILDGNHRCAMMKHLGHKNVFVRKT